MGWFETTSVLIQDKADPDQLIILEESGIQYFILALRVCKPAKICLSQKASLKIMTP